jgi:hypothetical protein
MSGCEANVSGLLRVEAPTDPQLALVARLCEERGYPQPAVYSKTDAGLLIDEIRTGMYRPPEWDDEDVPF